MQVLLRKLLRRIAEAKRTRQFLLSFLSTIALTMFPHCCNDINCLANRFQTKFAWRNMERIFSVVNLTAGSAKFEAKQLKKYWSTQQRTKLPIQSTLTLIWWEKDGLFLRWCIRNEVFDIGSGRIKWCKTIQAGRKSRKWNSERTESAELRDSSHERRH